MKFLWQQIPSSEITTLYCATNFDGIVLDDEHGCFNNETLFTFIQLINAWGKLSYVRLTEVNKSKIRMLLDAGVHGLIFSTIENKKQVKKIINTCYYPPKGKRGQGLVAENGWGKYPELLQVGNPTLIAQIETQRGIKLLPEIKDDFDHFMLGPYDLTADLGCVAEWDNLEYQDAVRIFNKTLPDYKKAVHIVSNIETEYKKFENYEIVAMGMDTTLILDSLNKLNKYAKH